MPGREGFWGPPTSSVDWCEANYRFSPYVCELFNTLSSFGMVAFGAIGLFLHRHTLERRFLIAFFAIIVIGLGSVAFHATLRFELQLLDELPMVYLALVMVYILLEHRPGRRFGAWFPSALAGYGALLTLLSLLTRGRLQFFIFHLSFGSLEFFALYRVYRLFRESQSAVARRIFLSGIVTYLSAVALWFVDIRFCWFVSETLPRLGLFNPELHAVWHLLVSLGFYLLVVMVAHERLAVLGRSPAFSWLGPLPFVTAPVGRALPRDREHD